MLKKFLAASLVALSVEAHAQQGAFTIDNYPRYGTTLDARQQDELRRFARAIAGALLAGKDVTVSVHGHADFDAKGRAFELEVSRDRARAAEAQLRTLLTEEASKAGVAVARLAAVRLVVIGNGTNNPIHRNPTGGAESRERRENRRVEFVWGVAASPAPVQQDAFDRCRKVIAQGASPGPTRRIDCVCGKLAQSATAHDFTYDFRASRQIPGSAGTPRLSPEQWDTALRSMIVHLRPEIQRISKGSGVDADFRQSLVHLDDSIGRSINDFVSQENAGNAMGAFDRVVVAAMAANMNDPNHVYACYRGYSRANADQ